MTLSELGTNLAKCGLPKDAYSLTGGLPNETYCIEEVDGNWHVYYSERGTRTGNRVFDNEQEACDYFFHWVTR